MCVCVCVEWANLEGEPSQAHVLERMRSERELYILVPKEKRLNFMLCTPRKRHKSF